MIEQLLIIVDYWSVVDYCYDCTWTFSIITYVSYIIVLDL